MYDISRIQAYFPHAWGMLDITNILRAECPAKRSGRPNYELLSQLLEIFTRYGSLSSWHKQGEPSYFACTPFISGPTENVFYSLLRQQNINYDQIQLKIAQNYIVRFFDTSVPWYFTLAENVIARSKSHSSEGISLVFDHKSHQEVLGFKFILLCLTDGISTIPLNFRLVLGRGQKQAQKLTHAPTDSFGEKIRLDSQLSQEQLIIQLIESTRAQISRKCKHTISGLIADQSVSLASDELMQYCLHHRLPLIFPVLPNSQRFTVLQSEHLPVNSTLTLKRCTQHLNKHFEQDLNDPYFAAHALVKSHTSKPKKYAFVFSHAPNFLRQTISWSLSADSHHQPLATSTIASTVDTVVDTAANASITTTFDSTTIGSTNVETTIVNSAINARVNTGLGIKLDTAVATIETHVATSITTHTDFNSKSTPVLNVKNDTGVNSAAMNNAKVDNAQAVTQPDIGNNAAINNAEQGYTELNNEVMSNDASNHIVMSAAKISNATIVHAEMSQTRTNHAGVNNKDMPDAYPHEALTIHGIPTKAVELNKNHVDKQALESVQADDAFDFEHPENKVNKGDLDNRVDLGNKSHLVNKGKLNNSYDLDNMDVIGDMHAKGDIGNMAHMGNMSHMGMGNNPPHSNPDNLSRFNDSDTFNHFDHFDQLEHPSIIPNRYRAYFQPEFSSDTSNWSNELDRTLAQESAPLPKAKFNSTKPMEQNALLNQSNKINQADKFERSDKFEQFGRLDQSDNFEPDTFSDFTNTHNDEFETESYSEFARKHKDGFESEIGAETEFKSEFKDEFETEIGAEAEFRANFRGKTNVGLDAEYPPNFDEESLREESMVDDENDFYYDPEFSNMIPISEFEESDFADSLLYMQIRGNVILPPEDANAANSETNRRFLKKIKQKLQETNNLELIQLLEANTPNPSEMVEEIPLYPKLDAFVNAEVNFLIQSFFETFVENGSIAETEPVHDAIQEQEEELQSQIFTDEPVSADLASDSSVTDDLVSADFDSDSSVTDDLGNNDLGSDGSVTDDLLTNNVVTDQAHACQAISNLDELAQISLKQAALAQATLEQSDLQQVALEQATLEQVATKQTDQADADQTKQNACHNVQIDPMLLESLLNALPKQSPMLIALCHNFKNKQPQELVKIFHKYHGTATIVELYQQMYQQGDGYFASVFDAAHASLSLTNLAYILRSTISKQFETQI